jgi:hypothetical protein
MLIAPALLMLALGSAPRAGAAAPAHTEFVTVYNHELPPAFHLATPTPGPLEVPFGAELVPSVSFSARVQPTGAQPVVDTADGAGFFVFGPLAFNVTDLEWHYAATGAPASNSLFKSHRIGFEAQLGIHGKPTIDPGDGEPDEAAFSAPVASITVDLPPVPLPSSEPVAPEAEISGTLEFDVKLYVAQAIAYVTEKLAEGAVAAVSAILTDGADVEQIGDALDALQEAELAGTIQQYKTLALKANARWDLEVDQRVPIGHLLEQLVGAEASALRSRVKAEVTEKLAHALTWLANRASPDVSAVYDGRSWLVHAGERVIAGAKRIVTKGWHLVQSLLSARRAPAPPRALASSTGALALTPLTSIRGMTFGPPLARSAAQNAANALAQYGFERATVRPLLVSSVSPRAGQRLCVAAAKLTSPDAAVELRGPGDYMSEALILTRSEVGGACLQLPANAPAGAWTVGVVDYNGHTQRHGVLFDVFAFTIHGS